MSTLTRTPAERIAGDLAPAVRRRLIRPGDRLPPRSGLMTSYGVAMDTAGKRGGAQPLGPDAARHTAALTPCEPDGDRKAAAREGTGR
ncbi:hypothetical protein GCM10010129_77790 [Streptomyces fumigatiscleroticus]|nr:hypothetical protein GCM10010129_77790 [Streptomyces fumigatiscleroticus]